jgi:hypothetical protein
MDSDYPFGDNAVRPLPMLCLLITLLAIMLFVLCPVMSSDYPFGDNAVRPSPVMSSDYPFGDNAVRPLPCYVF